MLADIPRELKDLGDKEKIETMANNRQKRNQ